MQPGSPRKNQEFAQRCEVLIAQLGLDEHRHLQCEGFSHRVCTILLRKRFAARRRDGWNVGRAVREPVFSSPAHCNGRLAEGE